MLPTRALARTAAQRRVRRTRSRRRRPAITRRPQALHPRPRRYRKEIAPARQGKLQDSTHEERAIQRKYK